MADSFKNEIPHLADPPSHAAAVTPSDTADLPPCAAPSGSGPMATFR